MNLLKLLPGVLKTVAKVVGIDVDPIVQAISGSNLPPEKQAELQEALLVHEKEMRALDVEEMKTVVSEAIAEVQSPDKYVSRARPTGFYAFVACTCALVIAVIAGLTIDHTLVLELILPLGGAGVHYQYLRTKEKMNGGSGS